MKKIDEYRARLPQTDCGICGAPTCDALARDIVCDNAELTPGGRRIVSIVSSGDIDKRF